MTTLTIQALPARRVPVRALALLDALWAWGNQLPHRFARQEPSTPAEVLALAKRLEATQPSFAADLRAAALAAQQDGVRG